MNKTKFIELSEVMWEHVSTNVYKSGASEWSYSIFFFVPAFIIEDQRTFNSRYLAKKAAARDLEYKRSYFEEHGKIPQWFPPDERGPLSQ